jgi:maleate isomerase
MGVPYHLDEDDPAAPPMGLIVLQTDETIEPEFARHFADHPSPLYVSRVPSGLEVTTGTLSHMAQDLTAAASLLPGPREYAVVGYGCTSGTAVIGPERIADIVQSGCRTRAVTNPLTAAIAACRASGISRLALLSPYIEEVNLPVIAAFAAGGVEFSAIATFDERVEERVVRISAASVIEAACKVGAGNNIEGVFMSCTNLRTYDVLGPVSERLGKPVLSSNQALAWHMRHLAEPGFAQDETPSVQ